MLSVRLRLVLIDTIVVHSKTVRFVDITGCFIRSSRSNSDKFNREILVYVLMDTLGILLLKSRRRNIAQPRIAMCTRCCQEYSDRHMRLPGIYHTKQTSELI